MTPPASVGAALYQRKPLKPVRAMRWLGDNHSEMVRFVIEAQPAREITFRDEALIMCSRAWAVGEWVVVDANNSIEHYTDEQFGAEYEEAPPTRGGGR